MRSGNPDGGDRFDLLLSEAAEIAPSLDVHVRTYAWEVKLWWTAGTGTRVQGPWIPWGRKEVRTLLDLGASVRNRTVKAKELGLVPRSAVDVALDCRAWCDASDGTTLRKEAVPYPARHAGKVVEEDCSWSGRLWYILRSIPFLEVSPSGDTPMSWRRLLSLSPAGPGDIVGVSGQYLFSRGAVNIPFPCFLPVPGNLRRTRKSGPRSGTYRKKEAPRFDTERTVLFGGQV